MRLRWTRLALADLACVFDFVSEDSPSAASDLSARIQKTAGMLPRYPELGREGRVDGTRELVVPGTPYIIAYCVEGKTVAVLSVIHAARKWPEAF